jgi:hypothetical protein
MGQWMCLALGCECLTLRLLLYALIAMSGWWKLRSLCKVRLISGRTSRTRIERSVAVCFHRAFDMTRSAVEGMLRVVCRSKYRVNDSSALYTAFDQICTIHGVTRILTRWLPFIKLFQSDL